MQLQFHFNLSETIDGIDVHEKIGCGKKIIGWIHSHVRGEKCFFSGLDNHTQYSSQKSNSNFLGVVMQINKIGGYEDHRVPSWVVAAYLQIRTVASTEL